MHCQTYNRKHKNMNTTIISQHDVNNAAASDPDNTDVFVFACETLPNLRHSVTDLMVSYCHNLTRLDSLPAALKKLSIWNCNDLTELLIADGLTELSVRNCPSLTCLPPLPRTLTRLNIMHCGHGLTTLPELPESLRELFVYFQPSLHKLPALPKNLSLLYVADAR